MEIIRLENSNEESALQSCVEALKKTGAVLLLPTETVYGLVCRSADPVARDRIYALKARSDDKPLAIFVAHTDELPSCGVRLSDTSEKIADAFCPGPITLVVPNEEGGKTGFRIPDHPFILKLLEEMCEPLAATSANRSGQPNALDVKEALEDLEGEVELAIDEGHISEDSLASTVIEVSASEEVSILRPGPVSEEQIRNIL